MENQLSQIGVRLDRSKVSLLTGLKDAPRFFGGIHRLQLKCRTLLQQQMPCHCHGKACTQHHELRYDLVAVQVWRPLSRIVEESPLGFIDAATVAPKDLNVHQIEFPGRTGFNYAVSPNPQHRSSQPLFYKSLFLHLD